MTYSYRAYGFDISSTIEIPSLRNSVIDECGEGAVHILPGVIGPLSQTTEVMDMLVQPRPDGADLDIAGAGRFSVNGGHSIIFDPDPSATEGQVLAYLLGSCMGLILHQRSFLPLHANALELGGQVFAFTGDSGAGKSTLAAYFQERGFRLLSDDICAIRIDAGGCLRASPGVGRLKLWRDAMEEFKLRIEGTTVVSWTDNKFEVPMRAIAEQGSFPIAGIYHLREAEDGLEAGIHRLSGLPAANAVTANIYRRRLADIGGLTMQYMSLSKAIIERVPIFSVNREWGFEHFKDEAEGIINHVMGQS